MYLNYALVRRGRAARRARPGRRVRGPAWTTRCSRERIAAAIDKKFENSSDETKTQNEQDFQLGFLKQFGDIGFIVNAISGAVFFTILILTGNTMSQAVRERIPELAVLKMPGLHRPHRAGPGAGRVAGCCA